MKDLTGIQFTRLTCLHRAKNRGGQVMWECVCSCGGKRTARHAHLLDGSAKSCGCIQSEIREKQKSKWPKSGDVFGRLTVVGIISKNQYKHVYTRCKCECGYEGPFRIVSLLRGETKSCGCLNDDTRRKHKKPSDGDTKTCSACGKEKSTRLEFYRNWNSNRRYQSVCKSCKNSTLGRLKKDTKQYDVLFLEQGGKCCICGLMASNERSKRLSVDHCHITDHIRGLLCTKCNVGLGCFKDDPSLLKSAIKYLIMKSKPIEFPIPEGFTIPEGLSPGDDFDAVTTFRIKNNGGKVCIIQIGDTKLPGYDDSEDKGQSDYSEEAKTMQGMMGGGEDANS